MIAKRKRLTVGAGLATLVVLGLAGVYVWPEIKLLWHFAPLGPNQQGFPEYRHRQTGIVFVRLSGGIVWMGAQKEDPDEPNYDAEAVSDEGPVHKVHLTPFLIAKYEVCQSEWQLVTGKSPSKYKGDKLPVDFVSWDDCQRCCVLTGLAFPTEAQWEYACRAGAPGPFSGTGEIDGMGWVAENAGFSAQPVGQKKPNGFGLYDMHGNVQEWCKDTYSEGFYSQPEVSSENPVCSLDSGFRVVRGGCALYLAGACRSGCRYRQLPTQADLYDGFRPSWQLH